jgi:hypothetical protein
MRVLARATALGLLMGLALAGQAAAELAPRIASPPFGALAGPVFAGDGFVWGRQSKGGYEVVTMRDGARTTTRIPLPELPGAVDRYFGGSVEASDQRVVLTLRESACFSKTQCETRPSDVVYSALLTGPVGGELTMITGCTSRGECASDRCGAYGADVSEDAVSYSDCHGEHVRDFAPDASPDARDYPGRTGGRIAGPYLAAAVAEGEVKVSNWRTGEDVYDVSEAHDFDVQADGKLAFAHGYDVAWASPAEPFLHAVATTFPEPQDLRIAGDRIAHIGDNPPDFEWDASYRGYYFGVNQLDDDPDVEMSRILDESALYRMDFDGTRVLWADRLCRHAWLMLGSPGGGPSTEPPPYCPLPTIVHGSARFTADHDLRLKLLCDVPPGPACVGYARRVGRHGKPLTIVRYSIAEGHTKTLEFPRNGSLCRAGRGRVHAQLLFGQSDRRTVTVRGPTKGLPRC